MTDPVRLLDSADPATRRLLESAGSDRPSPRAAKATLVALGLCAPAIAAAAPAVTKGVLGALAGKIVIGVTAALVASTLVIAVAKPKPRPAPPPAAHPMPTAQPASTFRGETLLLRRAADALAAQQAAEALEALAEHEARFPRGLLGEEAAALKVEALEQSGDLPGARAALAAFHARYPDSPFAPVIKTSAPGDECVRPSKETNP